MIKKLNSEIPIVALTASSADEIRRNKSEVGYDDIITKPFDNDCHDLTDEGIFLSGLCTLYHWCCIL